MKMGSLNKSEGVSKKLRKKVCEEENITRHIKT